MKRKIYEPVRELERQTSCCPLDLAWRIVDEARNYFRQPIPEAYARKLARRAEAVIAHQPRWRKEAMSARGYGHILSFTRHWLTGILAKENPVLYRQLPESFRIGHPLPGKSCSRGHESAPSSNRRSQSRFTSAAPNLGRNIRPRFVHGCELLGF